MYQKLIDETIQCDMCGANGPKGEIYKSEDLIYLCPRCFEKIEAAPTNIRDSMERFLLGNVL